VSADFPSAILERLDAPGVNGTDTPPSPTATTYPYTVVYFDGEPRSSDREADVRITRTHGFQTVTVGRSVAQVRRSRERLVDALTDWVPTVTGRTVSKIEHDSSQLAKPDPEMPDRTLYIATDQWRAVSDPT
jgi:hypothetical protein